MHQTTTKSIPIILKPSPSNPHTPTSPPSCNGILKNHFLQAKNKSQQGNSLASLARQATPHLPRQRPNLVTPPSPSSGPNMVEKIQNERLAISTFIILLATFSFTCCIAAEFKKLKVKDIQLDGSLCFLPRSSAFGLGIAALLCISIAQIVGTSMAAPRLHWRWPKGYSTRNKIVPICLLVLSWISYGLAVILLGTGSSMNSGQKYGKGWLDRKCYVVNTGVYAGAGMLTLTIAAFILGLIFSTATTSEAVPSRTCPDTESIRDQQQK